VDESTDQIEREIRAERHRLGRNLSELEAKAKQLADWRTYYRNNPTLVLGLALGSGMLLGAWAGGARRSGDAPRVEAGRRSFRGSATGQRLEETWQTISDALLGVASAKVMDFIGGVVPGFTEQLDRRGWAGPSDSRQRFETAREPADVM
jgi:hypothetical protein